MMRTGRGLAFISAVLMCVSAASAQPADKSPAKPADALAAPTPALTDPVMPQIERDYIAMYIDAQKNYDRARRTADKQSIRLATQNKAHDIFGLNQVLHDWVGIIRDVHRTDDGAALWMSIEIGPGITFSTWKTLIFDQQHKTLLYPGTPIFETVKNLTYGRKVVFSATVIGARISSDDDMVQRPDVITRFFELKLLD